jgi:hypothetical protein
MLGVGDPEACVELAEVGRMERGSRGVLRVRAYSESTRREIAVGQHYFTFGGR